jgi:hypothetical protein
VQWLEGRALPGAVPSRRRIVVFVRTTTIQADPSRLDEGIAFARERVPAALDALDGSLGWTMLVDRQDGRCMVNSWWESEAALQASDTALSVLREQGSEILGGAAQPEVWEVAAMERRRDLTPGCGVRMTRLRVEPVGIEQGIDVFRTTSVPEATLLDGFCAMSLLVNRRTGEALATVVLDSVAAVEATRARGQQIRAATAEKSHAEILDVHEFELVEAQVSTPEHL